MFCSFRNYEICKRIPSKYYSMGRPVVHLKLWNFLAYTANILYSLSVFYTDKEILKQTDKEMNVQSVVEQPEIYIFSHCCDSIIEKLGCVPLRREHVLQMSFPLKFDNVLVKDTMRIFQGRASLQQTF